MGEPAAARPLRSGPHIRVMHNVEALLCARRDKVAGDQVELLIAGLKGMIPRRIARTQALLADLIGHIQEMQAVGGTHPLEHAARPTSAFQRVGRKVQHQ